MLREANLSNWFCIPFEKNLLQTGKKVKIFALRKHFYQTAFGMKQSKHL